MSEITALPCPFCGWEKIRVNEDKQHQGPLKGDTYAFAWCNACGTRGPVAYTLCDTDDVIYENSIKRWNERGGKK